MIPDPRRSNDILTQPMLRRAVFTNRASVVRLGVAMGGRKAYLENLAPVALADRVWCMSEGLLPTRYDLVRVDGHVSEGRAA